jgi:hypothetical protein
MAKTRGDVEEPEPSRRRADWRATMALRTRAAALKTKWMRRGRFAAHKDCTSEATSVMATTSEKEQHSMARRRKIKFGDMVLSRPGIRILSVEETPAKLRSVTN